MKFTSFEIDGNYKYGSVSDGNILPASADFSQNYPDLKAAISSEMAHKMEFGTAIPLEKVKLLPPIPNPQKIICAGLNYNKKYPVDVIAPEGYGEIVGGGQREDDHDVLVKRIEEHDLPIDAFKWYLDLRKYGSVPHSGFGLGLERLVAWVCGIDHIRQTIPFPRTMGRLEP